MNEYRVYEGALR